MCIGQIVREQRVKRRKILGDHGGDALRLKVQNLALERVIARVLSVFAPWAATRSSERVRGCDTERDEHHRRAQYASHD
jgi:hypothetical protein